MQADMDFPGKILLFGEYGILLNSMALSIPFNRFSGRFSFAGTDGAPKSKVAESQVQLKGLHNWLQNDKNRFGYLDLHRFETDLEHGLYFDSSIPSGSGLGSSGALTAALYARYAFHPEQVTGEEARKHLASVESYFHGKSSGIDPVTSWLKRPLLLENIASPYTTTDISSFLETYPLFLVNTGYNAGTGKLVNEFMADYLRPAYKEIIDNQFIPQIAQTIRAMISGDYRLFELSMESYSQIQLASFGKMIPEDMKKHFIHGIETGDFYLKLCGSGGGGYMLAIARDRSRTASYFHSNQLDYTVVEQKEILINHTGSFYKHLNF